MEGIPNIGIEVKKKLCLEIFVKFVVFGNTENNSSADSEDFSLPYQVSSKT
jgi:hypothetical protein